ncbi:hypothetical protein RFI_10021, partial [Reticulomyxa filosa]
MEDLRRHVPNWTLQTDDQLLRALEAFSGYIEKRVKKVQDDLELLDEEARNAQLQLSNTFNRFLMLQNTQFIENVKKKKKMKGGGKIIIIKKKNVKRVFRENLLEKKEAETKNDGSNNKAKAANGDVFSVNDMLERYRIALNSGMKAMDRTIPQSQLISALKAQHDLIEAGQQFNLPRCDLGQTCNKKKKDGFNNQPLPYIINTKEFKATDHIGLFGAFNDAVHYEMDSDLDNATALVDKDEQKKQEEPKNDL